MGDQWKLRLWSSKFRCDKRLRPCPHIKDVRRKDFQKTLFHCWCVYRKIELFGLTLLFHVIFCVWRWFAWLYLLKLQQLNSSHSQNSASFDLFSSIFFYMCTNDDERHQMALQTRLLPSTWYSSVICPSKSTSLSFHTRLPLCALFLLSLLCLF